MYAVEKLSSYISRGVYTVSGPFHPFGGAVDIIVVQQQDGSFKSSPWYVRFGKFQGVLKTKEKVVSVNVNEVDADFHMYLDSKGEAYFLKEVDSGGVDSVLSSPPSFGYETDEQSQNGRMKKSRSCDLGADQPNLVTEIDVGSQKIVVGTNSNRSQILGFMFEGKSIDDSGQVEDSSVGLKRESSLDCAEMAAKLLEVNWSMNFSANKSRTDSDSRLSTASNVPAEEAHKDLQVDVPGSSNMDHSNEVSSSINLSLRSKEEDIEIPTLDKNAFDEVISETVIGIKEINVVNVECEVKEPNMQYGIEQPSVKVDGPSSSSVSEEETGTSCTHCETLEISRIANDVSDEQGLVNGRISHSEFQEIQVHPVVLCDKADATERKTQAESDITKEKLNDFNLVNDGDSCEFPNTETSHESKAISVTIESKTYSVVMHSVTSDSVGSEVVEVIHQETKLEKLTPKKSLAAEQVESPGNESSSGKSKVGIEEPSTTVVPHVQVVSFDQILDSIEEAESRGICVSSSLNHLSHRDREEENLGEEHKMNNLNPSLDFNGDPEGLHTDYLHSKLSNSSIVPSESSEEDHFLFSDNDASVASVVECKDCISTDPAKMENHPLVTLDDIEESSDKNHEASLSSDKLAEECSSTAFKPLIEESNTSSSPMSILGSQKGKEEVERLIESLPILRSDIDNLEASNAPDPLSHSLGSSSEKLKRSLGRKDFTSSLKFDSDSEHCLLQVTPTFDDIRSLEKLKDMSTNSMIEISLCKHLLYEGMGVDAASQAFDAEKVDFEKFVSLAPDLVKNDRLVVRIGGRYLPWDAAAPVILGMVSFGNEQDFDPKGVITVDRVDKSLEGDASTIDSSGGSWKLWPFTFSRSKSMNSVRAASNGTKDSDAENASEGNSGLTEDKNSPEVKVAKKKVKSIVPTSEQLSTLNLKEGQNVVTFTFSTPMLGKQQVDARIYLWKWNTRIVISDVDGTITKSDVLGQFMPLVGKDWSQTGVAPLFSAIKENGYQLLFLSARAISQAYITRQFLLNLKQDGKALPAGPVVISPDGLFPSLFREVIRRAPHEFKIACLKDIKALFPPDCNPFYAGFGNRDTDEFSYLKVGIPKGKIFIINPKGEVAVNRRIDTKSYTSIHALVNGMFPPMSSAEQEEFNSWNYWRTPLPDINI